MSFAKVYGPLYLIRSEDHRLLGRTWLRQVDPPYRTGRGVIVLGLQVGLCRCHSDWTALDALNARQVFFQPPERTERVERVNRMRPTLTMEQGRAIGGWHGGAQDEDGGADTGELDSHRSTDDDRDPAESEAGHPSGAHGS